MYKGERVYIMNKYKAISRSYYDIIRVTDNYIEIKSKNTKHMWIISKPMPYIENKPIIIYHKHSQIGRAHV